MRRDSATVQGGALNWALRLPAPRRERRMRPPGRLV